jgi:hypothetical protein
MMNLDKFKLETTVRKVMKIKTINNVLESTPRSTALMLCNKAARCQRVWACPHKQDHWHKKACDYVIQDKGLCHGSHCNEILGGRNARQ